jgi:hypothetical protein
MSGRDFSKFEKSHSSRDKSRIASMFRSSKSSHFRRSGRNQVERGRAIGDRCQRLQFLVKFPTFRPSCRSLAKVCCQSRYVLGKFQSIDQSNFANGDRTLAKPEAKPEDLHTHTSTKVIEFCDRHGLHDRHQRRRHRQCRCRRYC